MRREKPIRLKTAADIATMDRANAIVLGVLAELGAQIRPGVDIADLDAYAEERTRAQGAVPAFKGYRPDGYPAYPSTLCVSINEQVVHGIPRSRRLREGDLVSIDFGVFLDGFCGDGAESFLVSGADEDKQALVRVTREALERGILEIRAGARVGDIGSAVQAHAEARGYSVVREYVGHGIGVEMHEGPEVPNYGSRGRGRILEVGMVLAIEPMVNLGGAEVMTEDDVWTVRTLDGRASAHFERSVAITSAGSWVLGTGSRPGDIVIDLPAATSAGAASGRGRA
jgi:methionyl aminopeptidase